MFIFLLYLFVYEEVEEGCYAGYFACVDTYVFE
jgi:hypothetical protein